jgi:riboflavin-specific deaminase-like protein
MRRLYPPEEAGLLPAEPRSPFPDLALPSPPDDRPFVYVNMAMTLDGRVVTGSPKAGFLLSGSEGDRRGMSELRARADAVMIGAGTLRAENPVLQVRYEDLKERRKAQGQPDQPRPIVVTRSGHLDPNARLLQDPGAMILTTEEGKRALSSSVPSHVEVWAVGKSEVNLEEAVRLLHETGIEYLLVEGGPQVTHSFVAAGLMDEFFITMAPFLKAGEDVPTLLEGPAFSYDSLPRLTLLSITEDGGELYLRYGRG